MKKILSLLLCLGLLLGSFAALAETYTGQADGMHGPVKVEFDVEDGKITRVKVVLEQEDPDYGAPALDQLPGIIVEKGNLEVDLIAGSTFTSKAIIEAIQTALDEAGLVLAAEEVAEAAEQPAAEGAVATYTGQADGMHGPIKVEFDVADGKITRVKIVLEQEDPDYGAPALDQLPGIIVEKGNLEVDLIAGSTFTSKAIIEAIQTALDEAGLVLAAEEVAEAAEQPAAEGAVATYTGQADGMHGPIKVEFDVADGKITRVKIVLEQEDPDYGAPAIDQLPGMIVEKGNLEVDLIAGSTFTSKAILEAIASVLPAASPENGGPMVYEGQAQGVHGPVKLRFEVLDGKITKVEITEQNEHAQLGQPAIEQMPQRIVEKGSTDVDVVAGSTMTSEAIIKAINDALAGIPFVEESPAEAEPVVIQEGSVFLGLGHDAMGRIGPGKDDKDVQVYSFNQVFAAVLFDAEGKILYAKLDQLEVASPNYDGDGMPHFGGFPGQLPYLYDENHDGVIDGIYQTNDEVYQADIKAWATKRERGSAYVMGTGTWAEQMNAYESFFVGKTVAELEEIFARAFSSRNGRPLKDGSSNEEDKAKYDALSEEDKALLADVTTSATMSLNDGHGNLLAALKKAYDNRIAVADSAKSLGLGKDFSGRIGPGKDASETQVYSFNQVFTVLLLDGEDKIVQAYMDQVEVASPNYDGDGMPHFSGFPGQGGYNYDLNHDGTIVGRLVTNNEGFLAEVSSWATKRERGDAYVMGTGTWAAQMDAYQALFAGKTVDELDQLFVRAFSDRNGRPLKDGSSNEEDKAKYDALSEEDKALLADVVSSATMSLNDSHGNLLAALRDALQKKVPVEITISK